jgi:predicted cobalt transporter CbtA
MARSLLLRGMLVGLLAGLLGFAFARWAGEPQVDRAIAFETSMDQAKGEPPEPDMVSRKIQKGFGLLTGVVVYGTALGGIFGLVFAYARGRLSDSRPRVISALLASIGFVTIVLTPSLKYPANPPSAGNPETIGIRTAAYFLLIATSIVVMALSLKTRRRWSKPLGEWNATLLGGILYVVIVSVVAHFLPPIDEVPAEFPASLLWKFRIASWETQAVMWSVLGLLFGWLTERAEGVAKMSRPQSAVDELHYS